MVSAILAVFTFIGNYLSLFLQKGIQPFLIEISKTLIERVFVTMSLNETGPVMVLKIQMFCGLTGNQNFWILLIFTHHSKLDVLGQIKHPGPI